MTAPAPSVPADVAKSFGPATAVDGLSLTVHQGETIALLGPDGAAMTTTLSVLLGLRPPDRGGVEVFGQSPGGPWPRAASA